MGSKDDVKIIESTFYCDKYNSDLCVFLIKTKPYVEDKIRTKFKKHKAVIVKLVVWVQFEELDSCGNRIGLIKHHIISDYIHIFGKNKISDKIESMHFNILNKFTNFNMKMKNAKYVFDRIIQLDLQSSDKHLKKNK